MQIDRRTALRGGAAAFVASAAGILALPPARALVVQPIQLDMRSQGSMATSLLRATNDHGYPLPVEVSYEKLTIPESGPPTTGPATGNEFLIFPPQATIPVGATQAFRLQWVGDPALPESQIFMFSVKQLPVPQPGNSSSSIELLYSIQEVIAVAPPRGAPALNVIEATKATTRDGKPAVQILVANTSPVHGYASYHRLSLRSGSWSQALDAGTVNSAVGIGLVPGNARRRFTIPADIPDNVGTITATLAVAEMR